MAQPTLGRICDSFSERLSQYWRSFTLMVGGTNHGTAQVGRFWWVVLEPHGTAQVGALVGGTSATMVLHMWAGVGVPGGCSSIRALESARMMAAVGEGGVAADTDHCV